MLNDRGSIAVTRLHHGGLYVSDLEATRDFYVRVLGFEEIPRPASFKFPGAWFRSGTAEIHATVELEPGRVGEFAVIAPRGKERDEGFWPHWSLQVEDVDAAQAAVEAARRARRRRSDDALGRREAVLRARPGRLHDRAVESARPGAVVDYSEILARARLSGLRVAPDGARLVVSVAEPVDGRTRARLVEVETAGGTVGRRLDPPGGSAYRAAYLGGGRLLLAVSGDADTTGLWTLGREGFARILPWPNPILALHGAGAVVAFLSARAPGRRRRGQAGAAGARGRAGDPLRGRPGCASGTSTSARASRICSWRSSARRRRT